MTQSLAKPKSQPFTRSHLLRDASWQAVYEAMQEDAAVHVFGEGCEIKAHYDAPAIERDFPGRIHTMPISEDGNLNACVGAAALGVKPVCDLISADFAFRAMDSICNTAAKFGHGRAEQPTIVIRMETLLGGPTTGQRPEALFCHIPGLRVVCPSTPHDAYGLMKAALATPGVTVYIEDRMVEDGGEPWNIHDLAMNDPTPFGRLSARFLVKGSACAILTYGVMRQRIQRILGIIVSNDLYAEPNYRADLYDLRSLCPLDLTYLKEGHIFKRTSNLLVVEPDITYGGVGAEIAAWMAEHMPRVKVKRLGAQKAVIPHLPHDVLPTDQEVRDAIASFA